VRSGARPMSRARGRDRAIFGYWRLLVAWFLVAAFVLFTAYGLSVNYW
jgi:hypothetical protein